MNHISIPLKKVLDRIDRNQLGANKANAKFRTDIRALFNDKKMFEKNKVQFNK